jgi:hypothetical protein
MLNATPGDSFHADWVHLLPGAQTAAVFRHAMPFAFMDDGTEYQGVVMHSPRIPKARGKAVRLEEIKLLHLIYIDPERMLSRHRWYKCLEYIERHERPWDICIRYQDSRIKTYDAPIVQVASEWVKGYTWLDAYRSSETEKTFWWDEEVLDYFDRFGTGKFSKLNIWEPDWSKKANSVGRKAQYRDPRSWDEILVHHWIGQYREKLKQNRGLAFKLINLFGRKVLRLIGW